jgi:hypothetical protein
MATISEEKELGPDPDARARKAARAVRGRPNDGQAPGMGAKNIKSGVRQSAVSLRGKSSKLGPSRLGLPFAVSRACKIEIIEPDVFTEKIDECAHARRQRSALPKEDGVDVFAIAWIEILKHRYESAGLDVGADMKQREPRQTDPAKCERARGLAIAGARHRRR